MDPIPVNPPQTGWMPTTSTIAGAMIGGSFAQLASASISYFTGGPLSAPTAMALSTVCIFLCGYIFPDGGRK